MKELTTFIRPTRQQWQELTEAVNAANLGVAKIAHQLRGDGWYEPTNPLNGPIMPHGPLSWTNKLHPPSPTPAPICDAPHCGCAEGEECAANKAGDPVKDSYGRLEEATMAELRGRLSALKAEQRERREVVTAAVTGDVVTVSKGFRARQFGIEMLWGLPDVSEPFAGVTEHARVIAACDAKLDGLSAKIDALAERLDGNVRDKKEILALRAALADTANALGGRADPGCSLGFLQEVPKEAELVVARLKEAADLATEGFADPRAASSREVRDAVTALQKALGVGQTGIVGRNTMAAIRRIQAGEG